MADALRRDDGDAYVVFDTETTGIDARRCRVIEIGAVRIENGRFVARFSSLLNPGVSVPRRITQLTGITTAEVVTAPLPEEVLPAFMAFCEGATLVAHNATFDYRFVNAELARLGIPRLAHAPLCTVKLARRILPGLRSKSLRSLIGFYGLKPSARHRALADADMTAEIFLRLQERARLDHSVDGPVALRALMTKRYAGTSAHLERIRNEVLPQIPPRPGVYQMMDERGRVLYIGKAARLSLRVRSYFSAVEAHPPRLREMLARVRHVRWEETPTELQALLQESRLIKKIRPPFNKAQLHYRRRPYLRVVDDGVSAHMFVRDDGAVYYGPVPDRSTADLLVSLIGLLFPGAAPVGEQYLQAGETIGAIPGSVEEFLSGRTAVDVRAMLDAAMQEASQAFAFERAAVLRDWHALVTRLAERPGPLLPRVFRRDAVVVRTDGETREYVCVRAGRIADIFVGGSDPAADEARAAAVFERVDEQEKHRVLSAGTKAEIAWSDYWGTPALGARKREIESVAPPTDVDVVDARFNEDADEAHILAHWMYVHRAEVEEWSLSETSLPVLE